MENGNLILEKLLQFQLNVETIKKDGKNSFFKKQDGTASKYATLPHILSEVKPILNGLKLLITQPIINGEVLTVITCTESGQEIKSGVFIPTGLNAQQIGSAITYFRRYTLSSLLSLEIDEDDDGNKASQPVKTTPPAQKFEKEIMEIQKGTSEHELKQIWAGLSKEAQASQECIEAANNAYAKIKPTK